MKNTITIVFLFAITSLYSQSTVIEKKNIEKQIVRAGAYYRKAQYEKSLEMSKKALVAAFKISDNYLIAHSYNSIGVVYDEFSQSGRAIDFYNKALLYANKTENDSLKEWIYSNLGSTYYFNNVDVNKGIRFYEKSLTYAEKIKDSTEIAYTKLNMAAAYFSINDFKSGILYVEAIRHYFETKGDAEARFHLYNSLGTYYSNRNDPKLAEKYYFKAMAMIGKENQATSMLDIYENLALHYKRYHRLKKAYFYKEKLRVLNDTLFSEEKKQSLDKSAIQIELDEYKSQFEKIESTNEAQKKKIQESKLTGILFLVIMIVLLLFIYTLYKNNNARKKLNEALTKSNEELKIAKEKAEENSQLKTQFVATVSHELRTPLYGVIGIADMIQEEHKDLVNNEYLRSLKFSARYLLALVNDILQMNKMEDKKIMLENAPFDLKGQLRTIKKTLQFMADSNSNAFIIDIDEDIPGCMMGDELRLSQILMNLASNALKFTQSGEVKVVISLEKVHNETYFVKFVVKDNGIGIAEQDHEKIFDKFVQIERKEGDYQGTGLGLPIVKRLIDLFDSELYMESRENVGTMFTFTIGFKTDYNKNIMNETQQDFKTHETPVLNILVVEDNKINQMVTQKIIERNKHKCHIASNGHEAIEMVETAVYDAILMDINMPVMNGYEATKKIREIGIKTPIFALTAFDKREVMEESLASGINDVIIKPFEPASLFKMIYDYIDGNRNHHTSN